MVTISDILEKRINLACSSMGNRLFVISRILTNTSEVFDRVTEKKI